MQNPALHSKKLPEKLLHVPCFYEIKYENMKRQKENHVTQKQSWLASCQ